MPPKRFGPYELVRPLASGGMAETFVAVRRGPADFEQRVCLKRILPKHAGDAAFVEQFLDEARLLAQLRSPGIVQVHDFGAVEGSYYMALELVDGSDLERLCDGLPPGERWHPELTVFVAGQLLRALEYVHNATLHGEPLHIVHRDISPSNILLSMHGDVKLADFGIAKSTHSRTKTKTGRTKGKLAYMSPEQVRGDALDARSDLFAVGIVLYELLAGVHPFEASTDFALLHNIVTGTRRPLAEAAPGLDATLVECVERLLAVEADDRHASAEMVLTNLPVQGSQLVYQRMLASKVSRYVETRPVKGPFAADARRDLKRELEQAAETRDLPAGRAQSTKLEHGRRAARMEPKAVSPRKTEGRDIETKRTRPGGASRLTRTLVVDRRFGFGVVAAVLACLVSLWFALARLGHDGTAARPKPPTEHKAAALGAPSANPPSAPKPARIAVEREPTEDARENEKPGARAVESNEAPSAKTPARRRARAHTPAPVPSQEPSPTSSNLSRSGLGVSAEDF